MKFQNPSFHCLKLSNFSAKWKNQSKCKLKFSKVNQVIHSSAPISIPNMKAVAQILFEISCTQDFQILFSKGHNSEKGHNLDMKKNMGQLFFHEESVYKISKP